MTLGLLLRCVVRVLGCAAPLVALAAVAAPGLITNINPPSNLLPPGGTSVALTFNTTAATTCGYSIGTALALGAMQPIDPGGASTSHAATILGLSADTQTVSLVYVRCAADADNPVSLQ